ncbi:hypothetical protein H4O14_03505 [Bacillus sp. PAMC26568]|nr:hypothetical protein H4O14_03505 [Bacillus sp. PAMC26568]
MGCGCGGGKRIITDLKRLQMNKNYHRMIRNFENYRQVNNKDSYKKENKDE